MRKKLNLCLLIFFSIYLQSNLSAQNKLKFDPLPNDKFENLSKQFKEYKILSLDQSRLATLNSGEDVSIQLEQNYNFVLKENKLFSPDYIVSIKDDSGIQKKSLQELNFDGRFYRNADSERDNILCLSSYNETYSIYVKANGADFYIEPLKKYQSNAKDNEYIYYKSENVIITDNAKSFGGCKDYGHVDDNTFKTATQNTSPTPNCLSLDLALAIDYAVFENQGSNINLAIYFSANLINLVQSNFTMNKGLIQDIHFKIVEHRINTTATCNSWPPFSTLGGNVFELFSTSLNNDNVFSTTDYDIAVYMAKYHAAIYDGINGQATLNTLCTNASRAIINVRSNNLFDTMTLSHEFGHVFGCNHPAPSEPPSIMNSSALSWTASLLNVINPKIESGIELGTCFSLCETNNCETQQAINLNYSVNSTTHIITISWAEALSTNYKVRLFNFSSNTWTPFTIVDYPNTGVTYSYSNIHCQDKYKFEIVPLCYDISQPGTYVTGTIKQIAFDIFGQGQQPTIHIDYNTTPDNEGMCVDLPSFYIATGLDWGVNPAFQWKKNGVNVGTSQNTLSILANNGDIITCDVTSSDTCVINSNATSNSIVVNLAQPSTPTINFSLTCADLSAGSIWADFTNGGANPTFAWYVNNVLDTTADSTSSFYFGTFNNGDVITVVMTSSKYCLTTTTATATMTVNCDLRLDLRLLLEGYYTGNYQMAPVLLNQGVAGANANQTDQITVELRDPTTYTILGNTDVIATKDGYATCFFQNLPSNSSYYIVVKHRNTIETWSAQPVSLSIITPYDFTTASSQAYGNNMKEIEPGIWAFYTGDINQDSFIDNSDYSLWETDANNFASGYYSSDLNGDGNVDNGDYTFWEENANNFIYSIHP